MLNEKIKNLLNTQIQKEFESAYLYLDIYTFYESKGLHGFASWFKKQTLEELKHGDKILGYLLDCNEYPKLFDIDSEEHIFHELGTPLQDSLKHEQYITSLINQLYLEAEKQKDLRTMNFLQWFIEEQAEEETSAQDLISAYSNFSDSTEGLFLLDQKLGERK